MGHETHHGPWDTIPDPRLGGARRLVIFSRAAIEDGRPNKGSGAGHASWGIFPPAPKGPTAVEEEAHAKYTEEEWREMQQNRGGMGTTRYQPVESAIGKCPYPHANTANRPAGVRCSHRRRKRVERSRRLQFYFANVTSWSSKAEYSLKSASQLGHQRCWR